MDTMVSSFIEIRNHVLSTLSIKIETYLTGAWDSFVKHLLIKETTNLIERELIELFPEFPCKCLPKCRFRIFEDELQIEAGVQNYYNDEPGLTYLGTTSIGDEMFDCYYRIAYDPQFDYMFIARYGHQEDEYYIGSKTAQAEYYLGQYTPLALAYGLAVEDGYIG